MQLFSQIDRAAPSLFASRHDGHGTDSEREWNGSCKINNGFSPIRMASPEERNMRIESFSRRIAKNLLWNITGQGWLLLLTFLATPFLIRRLGVELYGIYILVAILVDYCSFAQFGIVDASVKYVTERRARGEQRGVQETFWTAMLSQAVIGFAGAMTILSLTDLLVGHVFRVPEGLVREARFAITMGAMSFSLSMVTSVTTGALRAVGRFDLINIAGILWGTLQTGAAVALLWLGQSLSAILFSNLCVQLLSLVMLGTFARRLLPVTMPPAWSTAEMKRLLRFGGFLTVSGVAGPILTNIEKMILSAIHTVSALTYYHVPFSLINRLAVIPSSFSSVLFPAYSYFQGKQDMEANRSLHRRSTLYLLYLFGAPLLFCIFFGHTFLAWWVGSDFAEASTVILMILSGAGLVNALAYPSITLLNGMGRPHIPAAFHVIETLIYIPVCYCLILTHGLTGAASAWFFRVFLDMLLLHAASCRCLGQSLLKWYLDLLSRGLPYLLVCGFTLWGFRELRIEGHPSAHVIGCCLVAAFYGYTFWMKILDAKARDSILGQAKGVGG
jgi:O-antigen/teichoic acid export membrane protein